MTDLKLDFPIPAEVEARMKDRAQLLYGLLVDYNMESVRSGSLEAANLIGYGVDWSELNYPVMNWVREHTVETVQQITNTSMNGFMKEFHRWNTESLPLADLKAALTKYYDPVRANMIATTEVTRAYAEGNKFVWKNREFVQGFNFNTAEDDEVCDICEGASAAGPYDLEDDESTPPLHVNCRCYLTPQMSEEVLDDLEITTDASLGLIWNAGPAPELIAAAGTAEIPGYRDSDYEDAFFRNPGALSRFERPYEEFYSTLSGANVEPLEAYTDGYFKRINEWLRKSMPDTRANWADRVKRYVGEIDDLIAKAPKLQSNLTVFRGVGSDDLAKAFKSGKLKVGGTYIDKAYQSTSITSAESFPGNIQMEIFLPKGTRPGLYLEPVTRGPGEMEFLLKRNLKLTITKIQENPAGDLTVRLMLEK